MIGAFRPLARERRGDGVPARRSVPTTSRAPAGSMVDQFLLALELVVVDDAGLVELAETLQLRDPVVGRRDRYVGGGFAPAAAPAPAGLAACPHRLDAVLPAPGERVE